jgi:hypothetical protein
MTPRRHRSVVNTERMFPADRTCLTQLARLPRLVVGSRFYFLDQITE